MFAKLQYNNRTLPRLAIVMAVACALVAGCQREEPPIRSIEEFVADPNAVDTKLLICRSDRRAAASDVECSNARAAANRIAIAEERAEFEMLKKEAASELAALRSQRTRMEQALESRQQSLKLTAERKLAQGQSLTPEEARAIGIDPKGSLLVGPNNTSQVVPQQRQVEPTPVSPSDNTRDAVADPAVADSKNTLPAAAPGSGTPPKTLAEIRESLRVDDEDEAGESTRDD